MKGGDEAKEGGQCFLFAWLAAVSACWKAVGDWVVEGGCVIA